MDVTTATIETRRSRPRNRNPIDTSNNTSPSNNTGQPDGAPRHRKRRPKPEAGSNLAVTSSRPKHRIPNRQAQQVQQETQNDEVSSTSSSAVIITDPKESKNMHTSTPAGPQGDRRRGAKFNAGLTSADGSGGNKQGHRVRNHSSLLDGHDLVSTLARGLSIAPYTDCPICFNAIYPPQPTWSCSPFMPIQSESTESEGGEPQYCWTTFHLKCIKAWSGKNFNDVKAAWIARGEPDHGGEWRCPGCRGRRTALIAGYRCFCGSTPSPQSRLGIPHSCGNSCSRARTSCDHPCPLSCHPGPCPPCKVNMDIPCPCPRKQIITVRCSQAVVSGSDASPAVSCGQICSRPLSCGNPLHACQKVCHTGDCDACAVTEILSCWCQRTHRQGLCSEVGEYWDGHVGCLTDGAASYGLKGFSCGTQCDRPYDCGHHKCKLPCHPLSEIPDHCPFSVDVVTSCPCGKVQISQDPNETDVSGKLSARTSCTSPIPTCGSVCSKLLLCGHACQALCHLDPCPPCSVKQVVPCRCGSTNKVLTCGDFSAQKEVLCDRACSALRACGRHQCNRICCPLASFAVGGKGKNKKRSVNTIDEALDVDGLHVCDLVCGRMLQCGNHRCEERDHKGPCQPCLQSSFEEMFCHCGRTMLEPPIPCGTKITCNYPCDRPPPACGHPHVPHNCHMDDRSCPPCPFLTNKLCACGKKTIGNVKCSLEREKVGCGTVCGKLMACGFHQCPRICHAGECGECSAPCGKERKLCLPDRHACTAPCHAPSACLEDEPCQALITLSCSCGRIRQSVRCNRCTASPTGRTETQLSFQQPKCNADCAIAKRNAKLADALGINVDAKNASNGTVVYTEELIRFARGNAKFVALVEKTFNDFISSTKKQQVLPPMSIERRLFVVSLSSVYRMDTQLLDQEPQRSVQIIRRVDSRIPVPLLSSHIPAARPINLGKLADMGSSAQSWRAPASTSVPPVSRWGTTNTNTSTVLPSTISHVRRQEPVAPVLNLTIEAVPDAVPRDWEDDF